MTAVRIEPQPERYESTLTTSASDSVSFSLTLCAL